MKKLTALILSLAIPLSFAACGGADAQNSDAPAKRGAGDSAQSDGSGVSFTIFNSKSEIQEYLEEAAAKYGEENDVNIDRKYRNYAGSPECAG